MELTPVLNSTILLLPEIILIVTAIALIVIDPLLKGESTEKLFWIVLSGLILSFIFNLQRFHIESIVFSGALSLDLFAAYFNVIFIISSLLVVILSRDYISNLNSRVNEYYALILLCTSGMMILSSAKEFMSLFLGFEIMSLSVYILSGFNKRSARSVEAGIKYLVLGGFSSAVLLYGMALIYGASGTIYLEQIAAKFDPNNPLYIAGSALVLAGFIFKIGAFPLHQWIPDVYEGAPTTITGFMSVGVKAAAFAILLRVLFEGFSFSSPNWLLALKLISVLTMTIGNLTAIAQKSIKRMLAYSSIAHAGYALIGIVVTYAGYEIGLSSVLYYLLAYAFMNLGAFGVLSYLSRDGKECEKFEDVSGLWRRKPLIAIALGIFMFSLAGIPPTIGFFAKFRIFLSAIKAEFYWLAIIGIINSVVSAYYYLKVLVYAYMSEEYVEFPSLKTSSAIAITLLSLATLTMGVLPLYSWELALKVAKSFSASF